MIIHTFIDKSNTIVSNSNHNMGLNPIAELQYGDIVSRFLFDIDYSNIIDKINDGTFPNIKDIRHTIKMYNTGWTDYREVNNEYHGKERTASFDLILFKIKEFWDAGKGYDYNKDFWVNAKPQISTKGSNWYNRTTNATWENPGIYTNEYLMSQLDIYETYEKPDIDLQEAYIIESIDGDIDLPIGNDVILINNVNEGGLTISLPSNIDRDMSIRIVMDEYSPNNIVIGDSAILMPGGVCSAVYNQENNEWSVDLTYIPSIVLAKLHFDFGIENINVDVTDYINNIIERKLNNKECFDFGLGLCFSPYMTSDQDFDATQYVGFFTNNTNSFFEPYLETFYDDTINDDRADFFLNKKNKLYFYSNVNAFPTSLSELPTCTISGTTELGEDYTLSPEVKQSGRGVYYVEVNMSGEGGEFVPNRMFYDTWSNLKFKDGDGNIVNIPDVTLDFTTKDSAIYYTFGDNDFIPRQYMPNIIGISRNERIVRTNDVRKVIVDCRIPYTTNQSQILDSIKYRIYTKQGNNEVDVFSYHNVNKSFNNNYFLLDINSLLPSRYYVDIVIKSNLETRTHKDVVSFDIVNNIDEIYS